MAIIFLILFVVAAHAADTLTGVWILTGPMPGTRFLHSAVHLPHTQRVFVIGGRTSPDNHHADCNTAAEYDLAAGTWRPAPSRMRSARGHGHTSTVLPGGTGSVLVVGGASSTVGAEVYDVASGAWTPATENMLEEDRRDHTATLLRSGKVLVAGGQLGDAAGHAHGVASNAELFDPESGTWSDTGSFVVATQGRFRHTATLLPNGEVLVAGGGTNTAEIYDPSSGVWRATSPMRYARSSHTATLLNNGLVLVVGGVQSDEEGPELYDPVTGSWTLTSSNMRVAARMGHTTTLRPDGSVLVTGGWPLGPRSSQQQQALDLVDIYQPETARWIAQQRLDTPRYFHTATLLPATGRVLLSGGYRALTRPDAAGSLNAPINSPLLIS